MGQQTSSSFPASPRTLIPTLHLLVNPAHCDYDYIRLRAGSGRVKLMVPLRFKIALLVSVAIVVFTIVFAYQTVREVAGRERSLAERARSVAKSTAQYVLTLGVEQARKNQAELEKFLNVSVQLDPNIAFLVLTDAHGQFVQGELNPALLPAASPDEVQAFLAQLSEGTASLPSDLQVVVVAIETTAGQTIGGVRVGYSLWELRREMYARRRSVFLLAVFLLLLGITGSFYLARKITSPLEGLTAAMQKVATGDLSQEVPVRSQDEVGLLTRVFNEMTHGLRERERIKLTFARYVSRQVVEKILQAPETVVLTGERRRASILFADIRGFTALSARKAPEELLNLLNEYFSHLIDVIFAYGGTLDKFIGDAVMAVFNAPVELDHAELRAVVAGLEMQKVVGELNLRRRQAQQEEVQIGIGINTGSVIAGNVGSQKRLEYTVIGSEVNLAERIEAHTEPGQVLISEKTYQAVADYIEAQPLPPVRLYGFAQPVRLYRVLGVKTDVTLPDLTAV